MNQPSLGRATVQVSCSFSLAPSALVPGCHVNLLNTEGVLRKEPLLPLLVAPLLAVEERPYGCATALRSPFTFHLSRFTFHLSLILP
jgi:hypothetical protein